MTMSFTKEQAQTLARIFTGDKVSFRYGVADYKGFRDEKAPEICFAGRSNVGKSSLINALTRRVGLARASNTPGRTQELNYFSLGNEINVVDLPGYGFAKAPREKVDVWNALIRDYLKGRQQLRRIFILIDSRHGLKKIDEEIFAMLDKVGVTYQIVLTKADKISDKAQQAVYEETVNKLKSFIAVHPMIILTSAEKNLGLEELRHEIACFIPEYYKNYANQEE